MVVGGGLLPIGLAVVAISVAAARRQRTATLRVLSLALGVAVVAGLHDYLLATAGPVMRAVAPEHAAQRIFLLHYGADIVLLVMGGILSARFVGTLQAIEQLNRTLELRVAEREHTLAENYERLRQLERRTAAGEERNKSCATCTTGSVPSCSSRCAGRRWARSTGTSWSRRCASASPTCG